MKKTIIKITLLYIILHMLISTTFADPVIYNVAGDNNFPPYEYVDSNEIYKGFNVDMLKAISLVTGLTFKFMPMKWEDAYNAIENGQVDIIQGIKESPERKNKFLFSDSLIMNSQSIFILDENRSINNKNDLTGKTVALNIQDSILSQVSGIKNVRIIQYGTLEKALDALLDKQVDALIGNTLTVNYLCNENDAIELVKIVGDSLNEQKYAIAVGKDNQELLDRLNIGLKEIQKNGMYDILYRKWFGTPIKNTKDNNEFLLKTTVIISISMLIILLVINSVNLKLKEVIERKTEEQKVLVNELRHYDKMQFMDRIISSVAHEIRNPLTSIKIYTGQMKEKINNKEFMIAASEDIPEEIERIDMLIKEFVEYTSPRKPLLSSINLYEEVISSLKLVKLQVNNIKITVDIDKSYYIKFDINHFKQIVLNILLNSKDALREIQEPIIEIFAKDIADSIVLHFRDNGCGMNEENMQYIFEPFFTTKSTGNGVGMFVVKQIVEDNKGAITAESHEEIKGMHIIVTVEKGEKNEEQAINS